MRNVSTGIFVALLIFSFATSGYADDASLTGTWSLVSFVRETTDSHERYDQLGPNPKGYIGYSPDGRMYALLTSGNRVHPQKNPPSIEEQSELFQSEIAYAGTYKVEGNKVTHHLDVASDESRVGTDQVRFFRLEGDVLTITTAPNKSPIDGREGIGILVFKKVR
jgi:hypothetical protein